MAGSSETQLWRRNLWESQPSFCRLLSWTRLGHDYAQEAKLAYLSYRNATAKTGALGLGQLFIGRSKGFPSGVSFGARFGLLGVFNLNAQTQKAKDTPLILQGSARNSARKQ